jgi:hypothetical protein
MRVAEIAHPGDNEVDVLFGGEGLLESGVAAQGFELAGGRQGLGEQAEFALHEALGKEVQETDRRITVQTPSDALSIGGDLLGS